MDATSECLNIVATATVTTHRFEEELPNLNLSAKDPTFSFIESPDINQPMQGSLNTNMVMDSALSKRPREPDDFEVMKRTKKATFQIQSTVGMSGRVRSCSVV